VLTDTRRIDTRVSLFGREWARPFAITPTGFNGLVRPRGDAQLAQAAREAGVPFVIATPSNDRIEVIRRAAPDAVLWQQLYVMEDRRIAEQLIRRAAAIGCEALMVTVDVPVSGLRERDLRHGFRLPLQWRPGLAWDLATHPAWGLRQALHGLPRFANLVEDEAASVAPEVHAALLARTMDRGFVWSDLAWLRDHWQGPLVVKGVLHPEDARRAMSLGVDAVTVSNHGGRQLDAAPSSIAALAEIVAAVAGRAPVFIDGGFRRGGDVAKALALGASAVFLGRPLLWGLAAGGVEGASDVLRLFGEQLERAMVLLGCADVAALRELDEAARAA
jgi:(S)-mandelate dehydrogenase